MKTNWLCLVAAASLLAASAFAQVTNAYDNANLPIYSGVGGGWSSLNGGYGYNTWTPLTDFSGGGTYMENGGGQVDGSQSFGVYAGNSGPYDISRPLASGIDQGTFSIITRFNVADSPGTSVVNLRSGNNTGSFGSGELLSFGIANGNELDYTDSTGFNVLPSGEARGAVWDWTVAFNALAGTYTLMVTNLAGGFSDTISGNLQLSGTSVGSFGVLNTSSGDNQNLIFDDPTFVVPEPSTFLLGAAGLVTLRLLRRRR
jgi:hypothetical protein